MRQENGKSDWPLISTGKLIFVNQQPPAAADRVAAVVRQDMQQIIFSSEWVVEEGLRDKTGLSDRQTKAYRLGCWIEGIHFKRVPAAAGADTKKAVIWYNLPRINQYIQEA
ncbi:excisionase family protein [Yokenella regensburgei]|uniref:excisionase family protein n=1 Tax=Yokenella regensburgei TaxID=158877 RepID=UPI0035B4C1B9